MEITPSNVHTTRSRSRSRSRTSTGSRLASSSRRPSLTGKRSLLGTGLNKLVITPTAVDSDKSIPTTTATLDNTLPLDFLKHDLIALIKALKVSKWHKRQLASANLYVNRISGALTNSIYKLEYHDHNQNLHLPALLLRVYGKNVESIIDRESELAILIKLSQKKIGPRLLGIFANGRFEQFLDGFITLNKEQIRDEVISQMLARRMKDLHYRIELDPRELSADLPMAWRLIFKWLQIFERDYLPSYDIPTNDVFLVEFAQFKTLIQKYKTWLFDHYDADGFALNYKFCHNDTQYGNLLLHESFDPREIVVDKTLSTASSSASLTDETATPTIKATSNKKDNSLVVIDFEYSGPNFPAFDLANHFSEWMADYHHPTQSYYIYEDQFPSQLEQINLIKSYIEYEFRFPGSTYKTQHLAEQVLNDTTNAADLIQLEIRKLYNECIFWRATVQIYWGLWGLIQNGPFKAPASPNPNGNAKSEPGIDSTYTITTALESTHLDESAIEEDVEVITSSDDDFDYLKYSQHKFALVVGDLIGLGILDKSEIDPKYWLSIKYLDTKLFDV